MFGVCLRYSKNRMEAEDILQEGFIKVFNNLSQYRNQGSLEGWVRRTMVNTAINHYKRFSKHFNELDIDDLEIGPVTSETALDSISAKELLALIQELPKGYRVVFNLNILEGYTHKQIAEILDISENTSKSQLSRARSLLQKQILKLNPSLVDNEEGLRTY